jgi:hypothetical protein
LKTIALIPIYQSFRKLNNYERLSIHNNFNKLNDTLDLAFIGPKELKSEYVLRYPQLNFFAFKERYFRDINGYNRLMKSLMFYNTFCEYDFILITQTDVWVLGSSTDLYNFYKYDFNGAISINNNVCYGFNGGLSLRNVQSSVRALKSLKNYETFKEIWRKHFPEKKLSNPFKIFSILLDFTIRTKVHHHFNFFIKGNEDLFWSVIVPKAVPEFKVISPDEAVKFSWEHNCEELVKKYPLPFGCHGWWNYNYNFWKNIIEHETEAKN